MEVEKEEEELEEKGLTGNSFKSTFTWKTEVGGGGCRRQVV